MGSCIVGTVSDFWVKYFLGGTCGANSKLMWKLGCKKQDCRKGSFGEEVPAGSVCEEEQEPRNSVRG